MFAICFSIKISNINIFRKITLNVLCFCNLSIILKIIKKIFSSLENINISKPINIKILKLPKLSLN